MLKQRGMQRHHDNHDRYHSNRKANRCHVEEEEDAGGVAGMVYLSPLGECLVVVGIGLKRCSSLPEACCLSATGKR